jgi:phospholipid/cholesterol/gamma-HCH transport system substrate-binding protein
VSTRIAVPSQQLTDGAAISGVVDPNPFDSISKLGDLQDDIQQTMHALEQAGNEVASLAKRVDDAFGSETEQGRVKRLLDTTETAMAQFGQTMRSINEILGDDPLAAQPSVNGRQILNRQPLPDDPTPELSQPPVDNVPPADGQLPIDGRQLRQRIREGLNELPLAVREARITLQEFRVVLESANKNFKNLEGFTEPLGRRGEEIATSIVDVVDGLDRLVEEFSVLSRAPNSREGSLGQLIHNPHLYENINRLVQNANTVMFRIDELVRSLRPIRDDVRAFTDKVGREPGRIITGGLNPSPVK